MKDDVVECPATERESLRTKRDERQPDVLVEVLVEKQHRVLPDRPVVVEDDLTVPKPAHHSGEIFHLRGCHSRHSERVEHRRDAAADAQGEAPARESMHGRRPRPGDQRVASVVIGCGRGDLHAFGDGASGADERGCFLDVPAFGDERGAEAELLTTARLVHQGGRAFPAGSGQKVVAELVEHQI
ncbi:hypothetical protein A5784_20175 [Mycobacterium sp. 852013-50091_SCH5140682]|nr:hypothetical protein A5784_20175 [Mycobacterium sp. 852013-50091_SCH5140682]